MGTLRESGWVDRHIRRNGGYLLVELGGSSDGETADICRALAVFCVHNGVKQLLVKLGDEGVVAERSLRDAMTTMLLAGISPDFKLALLAENPRIKMLYRNAQRDLSLAGVDAKLFDREEDADRWLNSGGAAGPAA